MEAAKLSLPIRRQQQQIVDAVRGNLVTVVIGETGSGKTTQLAQMFLEEGVQGKGERSRGRWNRFSRAN